MELMLPLPIMSINWAKIGIIMLSYSSYGHMGEENRKFTLSNREFPGCCSRWNWRRKLATDGSKYR
jgi:hypothetical protein